MFTGIIEEKGKILDRSSQILKIERPKSFEKVTIGQSIAINGACLSVTRFDEDFLEFDVLTETFEKTNLGKYEYVNMERALSNDGRFEGHVVLGHVDGVATFLRSKEQESGIKLFFELPEFILPYIVYKGSITINGISLTIASEDENIISVAIIPLTWEKTNLSHLQSGDHVNIEADYLGKLFLKNHK